MGCQNTLLYSSEYGQSYVVHRNPQSSPGYRGLVIFFGRSGSQQFLYHLLRRAKALQEVISYTKSQSLQNLTIPFSGKAKDDSDGVASLAVLRSSPYLYIFLKEIYLLAPICVVIEILLNLWRIASAALDLYCSNRLLTLVNNRSPVPSYSSNCAFRSVKACRIVTWTHLLSYWLWHAKLRFHFCQSSYQQ